MSTHNEHESAEITEQTLPAVDYDAVVVGAGFGGMYALHKLREAGMSVVGFEAAPDVGGTWYWNRYPGARCDIPSVLYSYSWSPELRAEWEWSEMFAGQPEILRYAQFVADRLDLRPLIRFNTRVTSASFDEQTSRWTVHTTEAGAVTARYCVMALGNLSAPHLPDIPGITDFAGQILHTAQWPHTTVDFTGKRVAVIGTGSSGIQVIPKIAETAEHVVVLQRTPAFSLPARNRPLDDATREFLEQTLPLHKASADRGRIPVDAFTALVPSREEQWRKYEELWNAGGAMFIAGGYPNVLVDESVNDEAAEFLRSKIRQRVDDPVTAEDLCPTDYPYGVKRACLDTDYYETYNRTHVRLVNLRRDPIVTISADSVITETGTYAIDVLVLATGFDAMTGALNAVDIAGVDGIRLADAWRDGPKTYLGIAAAGFPNLFLLTAPGGVSVIGNVLLNNEHHVEWMTDFLGYLRSHGATRFVASQEAQDKWMTGVAEMAQRSLFLKADSWYLGANVPGKPRVFMPYIGSGYQTRLAEIANQGYPGFTIT